MRVSSVPRALVASIALLWAPTAFAQPAAPAELIVTGQPDSWRLSTGPAEVLGLGHANFGIAASELVAAVTEDFGADAASRLKRDDSLDLTGRPTMTTTIPWMTDAAPARLSFTFVRDRLVQANVEWVIAKDATPAQRAALVATAQKITANLYESLWQPLSLRRGARLDTNAVLVFGGEDILGRGVEISLFGVELVGARTPATAPPPASPVLLRVSYAEDVFGRNIVRAGDF